MIQFLQPIWLWAIGAITVPLFIHLWNIRQGKTLKVGSIVFLAESTRAHARSLRLSELLLLILRCLLLILLALLLSRPVWVKQQSGTEEKGWVLIGEQSSGRIYPYFKTTIDSLLSAGYTLRRFQIPFEKSDLSDTSTQSVTKSYWKTIEELNQYAPASLPVHVFTTAEARNFSGKRPAVSLQLHWHTFTPPDSISYAERVFTTNSDSIRTITRHSTTGGNWVSYKNTNAANTQADTTTIRILVYTDHHTADASYLRAAVNALRDFTREKITVINTTDLQQMKSAADWLFWLTDKPLPNTLKAKKILVYANGNSNNTNTTLLAGDTRFELYRQIRATHKLQPIWTNARGETILGKDTQHVYHFYSRFDPQWNNLVWNENFPAVMYSLIEKEPVSNFKVDNRMALDARQVMPAIVNESSLLAKEQLTRPSDLRRIFGVLVLLLFLSERLVTYYSKRTMA